MSGNGSHGAGGRRSVAWPVSRLHTRYPRWAWSTEADLDAKVERYSVQLGAYGAAVSDAVGEPVIRKVLLFAAGSESRVLP